jgi:uncharacterized integral membrane protein
MEFEKIFNAYSVFAVIVLLLITALCVIFIVINKADANLGAVAGCNSLENCTQIVQYYC